MKKDLLSIYDLTAEEIEKILQKAEAVTETLEKERETKVMEMSAQEGEKSKARNKGNAIAFLG